MGLHGGLPIALGEVGRLGGCAWLLPSAVISAVPVVAFINPVLTNDASRWAAEVELGDKLVYMFVREGLDNGFVRAEDFLSKLVWYTQKYDVFCPSTFIP